PPAARRSRGFSASARAGEQLSIARLPREPERALHGGALHGGLPGVLGAGSGGRATPRRACAAAGAGIAAAWRFTARIAGGWCARRDRRVARPRRWLCAGACGGARLRRRPGRRDVSRSGAATGVLMDWSVLVFFFLN